MTAKATFRQYLASVICLLNSMATGTTFVWLAPLMTWIIGPDSEIPMDSDTSSWIVASIEIGAVASPIPLGILADRWGRKKTLLLTGPIVILSWALIIFTRSPEVLFLARVIQGVGIGLSYAISPVYLAEISEPRLRGELCGHMLTIWYMGYLYSYAIGPYVSYQNYALACAAIPVVFTITFMFIPESPYYLLMRNKYDEAEKALKWFRASNDVKEDLDNIQKSVEEDMSRKTDWKDLIATKADRKALFIVQIACIVKYFTGNVAVVTYSTETFAKSTGGVLNEHQLTIMIGVVLCVSTFGAAFLADKVGRRTLLVGSALGSGIFAFIIGLYYFLLYETTVNVTGVTWIMNISVLAFCVVNSIGLGPLIQTIQAEYFPSHTRGLGGGVTGIVAGIGSFTVLKLYQAISDSIGVYLNYWIYSTVATLGSVLLYFILTETSGKTLGEIQTTIKNEIVDPESK